MHVVWQGDHKLLDKSGEKQDFERELTRLGLDPSKFLVEVRREPDLPGADGLYAVRYDVYISDLGHPDRERIFEPSNSWIRMRRRFGRPRARSM
jgi:hypothetical protein